MSWLLNAKKGTQSPLQTQVKRQMLVCMHSPCLTFASMQHGSRLSRSCLEVWSREKRRSGVDLTLWCFHDVFRVVGMHCKCTLQNTANCSIAFANKSCLPASGSQYGSKFYIAALKLYTAIAVYIYICIVITEKRCRNTDAHNTTTASSIKASFSCRFSHFYTSRSVRHEECNAILAGARLQLLDTCSWCALQNCRKNHNEVQDSLTFTCLAYCILTATVCILYPGAYSQVIKWYVIENGLVFLHCVKQLFTDWFMHAVLTHCWKL